MALSRRELLVLGGGVVCVRALGCGGSPPIVLDKDIPAGNATSVTSNSLKAVTGKSVAIGRDTGGKDAVHAVRPSCRFHVHAPLTEEPGTSSF